MWGHRGALIVMNWSYEDKQKIADDLNVIMGLDPQIDTTLEEVKLTFYIAAAAEKVEKSDPFSQKTWDYLILNELFISEGSEIDEPSDAKEEVPEVPSTNSPILNSSGEIETFGVKPKIFEKPSRTAKIFMLLCEDPKKDISQIKADLAASGYNTDGDATMNMQFSDCKKVLAYLNIIGRLKY